MHAPVELADIAADVQARVRDRAPRVRVAKACATVVALTGGTDIVTDGVRRVSIRNGHVLMSLVTAMGCAGSALLCAGFAGAIINAVYGLDRATLRARIKVS